MNVSTIRIPSVRMRISLLAATVLLVSGATTAWIQDGTEDPRAEFCPAIALGTIKVKHTIPNVGLVTFYRVPSAVKPGDLTTPITGHPRADYSPASYQPASAPDGSLLGAEGPVEFSCTKIYKFWRFRESCGRMSAARDRDRAWRPL